MKHVLYLSYDGMTDPLGQSQVLPYIIGLSKHGYHFTLISFEKSDRLNQHKEVIEALCKANNIEWHPLIYTKTPPVISTIRDIRMMGKLAKSLHQKHPFSLVHCRSYISALIGLKFKQQLGIPFLFDMRGFWADERIEGGIWNKSNPLFRIIYSFFKKKERAFFSQSDAIVSLTHKGKKIILDWNIEKVSAEKISVIPCCVDLDKFNLQNAADTAIKNELKASLQVPTDARIVGYLGSIGTWYMLNEMLAFFKLFKEKYPNAVFLFISTDPIEHIKNAAQLLGIDKDSILQTACLHSDVPKYISLFDISVFFIRPSFSKQASSPTKQGEIMAMGIPIVCNTGVGDTDEIIQQYKSGSLVTLSDDTSNLSAFDDAINQLEKQFDQSTSINGANDYFSLEKGVAKYKLIYERLIN